jgi:hypothetical protein
MVSFSAPANLKPGGLFSVYFYSVFLHLSSYFHIPLTLIFKTHHFLKFHFEGSLFNIDVVVVTVQTSVL